MQFPAKIKYLNEEQAQRLVFSTYTNTIHLRVNGLLFILSAWKLQEFCKLNFIADATVQFDGKTLFIEVASQAIERI